MSRSSISELNKFLEKQINEEYVGFTLFTGHEGP
jgi:hypothetical protein